MTKALLLLSLSFMSLQARDWGSYFQQPNNYANRLYAGFGSSFEPAKHAYISFGYVLSPKAFHGFGAVAEYSYRNVGDPPTSSFFHSGFQDHIFMAGVRYIVSQPHVQMYVEGMGGTDIETVYSITLPKAPAYRALAGVSIKSPKKGNHLIFFMDAGAQKIGQESRFNDNWFPLARLGFGVGF
jgi:hypothetical protein